MNIIKQLKLATIISSFIFCTQSNAASIGSFSFADNAIANELLSGTGQAYNGVTDYYGTGNDWLSYNSNAWTSTTTPTDITDNNVSSFLANESGTPALSLNIGFSDTTIYNGADSADIALFFLWDQTSGNTASVTINGETQSLSFSNVFSDSGIQQTAKNVNWNESTIAEVQLMVALLDLDDFLYAENSLLDQSIQIDMQSNSLNPMALSLVAGLNSGTPPTVVPLPAAVWLFMAGLCALGVISRRRK